MPKLLEGPKRVGTRRGRTERRLAEKSGMVHLPMPREETLSLEFDRDGGVMRLGGKTVMVDRIRNGGYQRDYEDGRAQQYSQSFNWGLFGLPLLSLRADGCYWIVAGQHRLAAAGYAGEKAVRVGIYEGLSQVQEAFLFNQEATQRRDLGALNKFWSGVQSGFPDNIAVKEIVEDLGEQIAFKSNPRQGNIGGVVAVTALLQAYDFAGPDVLRNTLKTIKEAWGTLTGPGIDGALFQAMAMFLATYAPGSQMGEVSRRKLVDALSHTTPEKLRDESPKGSKIPARFVQIGSTYNYGKQQHTRVQVLASPSWRIANSSLSKSCTAPGCDSRGRGKPGTVYRRGYCRKHYEMHKAGEMFDYVS